MPTNTETTQEPVGDRCTGSVLAVDDQSSFRSVLRRVVSATAGLVVVGEADSGEDAVDLARQLEPDLVLMDVRMPGIGGIEAAKRIKDGRSATFVLLLSATRQEHLFEEPGDCPADAFISKGDLCPSVLGELWRTHGSRRS